MTFPTNYNLTKPKREHLMCALCDILRPHTKTESGTRRYVMSKSKMVKGVPFDVRLPENMITRAEAMRAFDDLRMQASDLPEGTVFCKSVKVSGALFYLYFRLQI